MQTTPPPAAELSEHAADLPLQTLADGRYVLFGQLGHGSQASTFAAVDKQSGRQVAIKSFHVGHARSWKDVELAEREARILASLDHPALPRYYDHFEEQGSLYLVMERVEGMDLSRYQREGNRLSLGELRQLLEMLSGVLDYLHSRVPPVIHRDIKPGNIIRRPDGTYCLVDFGSVRDGMRPEGGSTVVGTFGYMAPEQFQGRAMPATDVYAVGALLLALITGSPPEALPHNGLELDVRAAIGNAVPKGWIDVIERFVRIDPQTRPASLGPLLASLDDIAPQQSNTSTGASDPHHQSTPEVIQRDPDASFTVMVGSGFGLLPFVVLMIARIAIWAALCVAIPILLSLLSIVFGPRLRFAARDVARAGHAARARLADASRHLRLAEPFVLQGQHYRGRKRRYRDWGKHGSWSPRDWRNFESTYDWRKHVRVVDDTPRPDHDAAQEDATQRRSPGSYFSDASSVKGTHKREP